MFIWRKTLAIRISVNLIYVKNTKKISFYSIYEFCIFLYSTFSCWKCISAYVHIFDTVIVGKILGVTALAGLLRSLGNSKAPLMAMLISSVTNIVLDLLFVVIFKWGIAGAAIATVIAQIIAAVFC